MNRFHFCQLCVRCLLPIVPGKIELGRLLMVWLAGLAWAAVSPAQSKDLVAQAPNAGTEPRLDAEGIPLPDGVIARLGSARFRFAGTPTCQIAYSADGKQMAVGHGGGVTVLDTATGQPLHYLPMRDRSWAQIIRFLSDGKRLAVGIRGVKSDLAIYTLADGKTEKIWRLPGENEVNVADITPDGEQVLAVDWFAKVYLWDAKAGQEIWSFPHTEPASVLPFTADGKHFILAGSEKSCLHEANTGKLVQNFPKPDMRFSRRSHSAGISSDGRLVIKADKSDFIMVMAAQGENQLRVLPAKPPVGRRGGRFLFSPDGRYLVDLDTQVWDLKEKDDQGPVARLPGAWAAGFSPDGKTLVLAGDGLLTFWSVGDWKRLPLAASPASPVNRAWFTPDGKQVLGTTQTGWIVWPTTGGPARRLSDDSPVIGERLADVSADGQTAVDVVAGAGKKEGRNTYDLRIAELGTGKVRLVPLEGPPTMPLMISQDGRQVSVNVPNVAFSVWDTGTGKILYRQPDDHRGFLLGTLPTADGRALTLSLRGTPDKDGGDGAGPDLSAVTITDHITGRKQDLIPVPWRVYSGGGRFSRDGKYLVLHGCFNNRSGDSVSVWDVHSGRRLMYREQAERHTHAISPAADHRSMLIGDDHGTLTLVETATGGDRAVFQHRGVVLSANFSTDGTKVVSTSAEAPVYVWNLLGDTSRWDAAKVDTIWAALSSPDAKAAFAAIRELRMNPNEAVAFLAARMKLPAVPTNAAVAKLLKGLDAFDFKERERSQRELANIADMIRPKLAAARKEASEEVRPRLDQALKSIEDHTPERLRQSRACEILEGIATREAVRVLKTWAAGAEGARLTEEARDSLTRLRR